MINTTPVLIAVPKLDSTPEIPIFPRMEVKLANTADPIAYSNQRFPLTFCSSFMSFFSIIIKVPTVIKTIPIIPHKLIFSCKKMNANNIVRMMLDLSIGTTLLILPSCNALK